MGAAHWKIYTAFQNNWIRIQTIYELPKHNPTVFFLCGYVGKVDCAINSRGGVHSGKKFVSFAPFS